MSSARPLVLPKKLAEFYMVSSITKKQSILTKAASFRKYLTAFPAPKDLL